MDGIYVALCVNLIELALNDTNMQQQHEEVLLISRSGNYSNYSSSSVINTASLIIDHGPAKAGSTLSIAGGVVYQGSADPALRGRYGTTYIRSCF